MSSCCQEPPVPDLQARASSCPPRRESWRWQTSNADYGKFYGPQHREFVKKQEVHKDCAKKCEDLSNELQLTKCHLEKLKITLGRSIADTDWKQDKSRCMRPSSPKLGQCKCPAKPGPSSGNMYVTEMMNQFNGAHRHDPQMLPDHIKRNHPHLVKKIPPYVLLKTGQNYWGGDQSDDESVGCTPVKMGCGGGTRSGSQSPRSARGRGDKRGCGVPGSRSRTASPSLRSQSPRSGRGRGTRSKQRACAPPKQRGNVHDGGPALKHTAGGGVNLPPTQRYDFYRYFGYAGQGAKTSKGWHSVKVPRTRTPFNNQIRQRCHKSK